MKLRPYGTFSVKRLPPVESMGKKTPENHFQRPEVDIRSGDVSDLDLSGYEMQDVTFDSQTKFPTEVQKCPQHFDQLKKIKELGMDPGLEIRSLHAKGLTGEGLGIAIIDQTLGDHQEYHDALA